MVGMGVLAGSTSMVLTVVWGGSLLCGRCDLEEGRGGALVAQDKKLTRPWDLFTTGEGARRGSQGSQGGGGRGAVEGLLVAGGSRQAWEVSTPCLVLAPSSVPSCACLPACWMLIWQNYCLFFTCKSVRGCA